MAGLARVLKMYGSMKVTGNDGRSVKWVYDYARDEPVTEDEMPFGSDRHRASERVRYGVDPKPLAPTPSGE
jgi:hypothetical protein